MTGDAMQDLHSPAPEDAFFTILGPGPDAPYRMFAEPRPPDPLHGTRCGPPMVPLRRLRSWILNAFTPWLIVNATVDAPWSLVQAGRTGGVSLWLRVIEGWAEITGTLAIALPIATTAAAWTGRGIRQLIRALRSSRWEAELAAWESRRRDHCTAAIR